MKNCVNLYKLVFLLFSTILIFNSFSARGFQPDQVSKPTQLTGTAPLTVNPDSTSNYIEPSYPGGKAAWMLHLMKNVRYPQAAMNNNIQGTVIVKFTVDEKGRLKNMDALVGPKELRNEAIRVLRAGGRWIPATRNGQVVSSEREQAITFRTETPEVHAVLKSDSGISSDSTIFSKVEIEPAFPNGSSAWLRYLNKTFRYPAEAQANMIQGTVVIEFIVDENGEVSNVHSISGPLKGGLREEAERVIRGSGKWTPAIQNGKPVKSYKRQPLTFKLERN